MLRYKIKERLNNLKHSAIKNFRNVYAFLFVIEQVKINNIGNQKFGKFNFFIFLISYNEF